MIEVIGVEAERLHAIDCVEIRREGIDCPVHDFPGGFCTSECPDLRRAWRDGWDAINGNRPGGSYESNPWLWVIRIQGDWSTVMELYRDALKSRGVNPFALDLACELVAAPMGSATFGRFTVRHVASVGAAPFAGAGKAHTAESVLKVDAAGWSALDAWINGDGEAFGPLLSLSVFGSIMASTSGCHGSIETETVTP